MHKDKPKNNKKGYRFKLSLTQEHNLTTYIKVLGEYNAQRQTKK